MVSELPPSDLPAGQDHAGGPVVTARPVSYAALKPTNPLDLPSLSRREAALDLALLVLVALLLPIGSEVAAVLMLPEVSGFTPHGAVIVQKWFDATLLVALAGYFVYRQHVPAAAFGVHRQQAARQVFWVLPALLAIYAVFMLSMAVVGALVLLQPELDKSDLARRIEFLKLLPLNSTLATLLLLVPVAVHEELLFRGLLIPYLHRVGCSWVVAVVISTAVFAVLHLNQGWLGIIQVFGVGAVLGTCFVLTRSLLTVMLAHFVFDLLQLQLARVLLPWLQQFMKELT
jgi:membrane protease YdiL (CAAX protease family)